MVRIRRNRERGYSSRGWLESRFTFSFAGYYDENHLGFGPLRVINEDWIRAGTGFGPHAHRDMEILTYVIEGRLEHRDTAGNHHLVGPNEIQTMSAGSGVVHSEANASDAEPLHLLQIWIEPSAEDLVPRYQQVAFDPRDRRNRLLELAGPVSGDPGPSTVIHQDVRVSAGELDPGYELGIPLLTGRRGWVQVVRGAIRIDGIALESGDGAAVEDQSGLTVSTPGPDSAEFLFFDLP